MKALSIRQPWVWAILHAGKRIENRSWWATFRGRFLIHASKGCTRAEYDEAAEWIDMATMGTQLSGIEIPPLSELPRGMIVGAATVVDCLGAESDATDDPWFCGPCGLVLDNVVPLTEPIPCKGELGFFNVPPEVEAEIRRRFG